MYAAEQNGYRVLAEPRPPPQKQSTYSTDPDRPVQGRNKKLQARSVQKGEAPEGAAAGAK